jgi:hypothetical protein
LDAGAVELDPLKTSERVAGETPPLMLNIPLTSAIVNKFQQG